MPLSSEECPPSWHLHISTQSERRSSKIESLTCRTIWFNNSAGSLASGVKEGFAYCAHSRTVEIVALLSTYASILAPSMWALTGTAQASLTVFDMSLQKMCWRRKRSFVVIGKVSTCHWWVIRPARARYRKDNWRSDFPQVMLHSGIIENALLILWGRVWLYGADISELCMYSRTTGLLSQLLTPQSHFLLDLC